KLAVPAAAVQADVLSLQHWQPVAPCADLFKTAWDVQDRYSFSWWDSTIVAAAILAKCKILLSEDLQHDQVVNSTLRIIDPFAPNAPTPESCS
ncbi:MAG: PIN domain-containing protein, partial [Zoogloeaceae bacterium]|nr:PIN domain-containing protein [Zoogloeaceae bacterium]